MTIASTTNRVATNGNDVTTAYPVTFPFHDTDDLIVLSTVILTGVETVQVNPTHYTVSGIPDDLGHYPNGGSVDFVVAPASTVRITIYRDPARLQSLDMQDLAIFPAESIEAQFDYLTMLSQRNADVVTRSLRQPDGDSDTIDPLPPTVDRASMYLGFDTDGDPIALDAPTSTSLTTAFIQTLLDDPDAATARATLGVTTASITDNQFRIQGSGDATKQLAFEVDGVTASTTRTVTIQDVDGTMALTVRDGFTTGDVKLTFKTTADTSWILMDDTSIGDASSGATGRANADTSNLYSLLWTNVVDQWAPVTGGRGANAAADFAAHKPMFLPKTLGRALAGYGTGVVADSGANADVDTGAANSLTVPSNNTKWITGIPVVFTLTSGTITGLSSGNTYYIIRSSATLVKLASSLTNAQNGTEVDLTAKSSPVWTITYTYTARVLGEAIGEQAHAQSITELLAHTHSASNQSGSSVAIGADYPIIGSANTGSRGGNVAMNIMQPTAFLNVMVKL